MTERDYDLVGEDAGTDPAGYGVVPEEEAGHEETEFGVEAGELHGAATPEGEDEERPEEP